MYFVYSRSPPPIQRFVPFVQSSTKPCIGNYISLASRHDFAVVASFIWGLPPYHGLLVGERERESEVVKEVGVFVFVCCWQGMFLLFSDKQRIFSVAYFWAIS